MKTLTTIELDQGTAHFGVLGPTDGALTKEYLKLREKVWVQKYHWESSARIGLETDEYDTHSTYLAVVQADEVLAGCRLILDTATGGLPIVALPTEKPIVRGGFEISRLCLREPDVLNGKDRVRVFKLLVDGIIDYLAFHGQQVA